MKVFLKNPNGLPLPDAGQCCRCRRAALRPFMTGTRSTGNCPITTTPHADSRREKLPGAGRDKYAGLNLAAHRLAGHAKSKAGPFHCVFAAATPHDPSYFEAYITKATYDPRQPLKWSDLEPLPGGENARLVGKNYIFDVNFPQRTGRHLLLRDLAAHRSGRRGFLLHQRLGFRRCRLRHRLAHAPARAGHSGRPSSTPSYSYPGSSPPPLPARLPPRRQRNSIPSAGNTRYENSLGDRSRSRSPTTGSAATRPKSPSKTRPPPCCGIGASPSATVTSR